VHLVTARSAMCDTNEIKLRCLLCDVMAEALSLVTLSAQHANEEMKKIVS